MKYTITGSLGHISKPVVTALVKAGHQVTVITSSQQRVKEIESMGAEADVGSVEDTVFLTKAFSGSDVVYTMVPPKFDAKDLQAHIEQVGKNYAAAIKNTKIKYVVNLSSMGAHMAKGGGPISGLHWVETALNTLAGVHLKHLRPAYFYLNLLSNISLIKTAGIMGSNFGFSDKKFTLVHPDDIAVVAVQALLKPDFTGHSVEYIVSDQVSTDGIAATIGKAINKPDLKWVTFTDEQALQGGTQAGLPEEIARNYAEMGHAINSGEMGSDYWKQPSASLGKIKLADFAKTFALAYNSEEAVAAH
ncbi:MAG TPA: NmrA family NAD(P)-binding protein [Chitinophagaceae bacterium]|nr:NmrA family NAD(P)-binding protein [Chitinophagaceae bacterium]